MAQHAVVGPERQMALPRSNQACGDPSISQSDPGPDGGWE